MVEALALAEHVDDTGVRAGVRSCWITVRSSVPLGHHVETVQVVQQDGKETGVAVFSARHRPPHYRWAPVPLLPLVATAHQPLCISHCASEGAAIQKV